MTAPVSPLPPHPVPDPIADAVQRLGAAVFGVISPDRRRAAAIAWRPGLLIATALPARRDSEITVIAPDGAAVQARLRGTDPATDLSLLEWPAAELAELPRRAPDTVRVGEAVFAAGRNAEVLLHASFGRIGCVGPAWQTGRGGRIEALLRLDGGLFPGLDGGPVVDAAGQLLGIASGSLHRHYGIVLPNPTVDAVVDALATHGEVARGYLGIAAHAVGPEAVPGRAGGLLVASVAAESPAARAGLLVGDIVTAVDGRAAVDMRSLRRWVFGQADGARVRVELIRGGQAQALELDVGRRPTVRH